MTNPAATELSRTRQRILTAAQTYGWRVVPSEYSDLCLWRGPDNDAIVDDDVHPDHECMTMFFTDSGAVKTAHASGLTAAITGRRKLDQVLDRLPWRAGVDQRLARWEMDQPVDSRSEVDRLRADNTKLAEQVAILRSNYDNVVRDWSDDQDVIDGLRRTVLELRAALRAAEPTKGNDD